MSLGSLVPSLSLTDPSHIHVGPHDPIKGHVFLEYLPPTKIPARELFAPIKISLILKCRLKSVFNSNHARGAPELDSINAPIFETKRCIFSGPLRITRDYKVKHPFEFKFPRAIKEEDDPLNLSCEWAGRTGEVNVDEGQALPSSKGVRGGRSRSEMMCEYKLHVEVRVPDMDVTSTYGLMADKGVVSVVVLYEQRPVLQPIYAPGETQRGYVVARLDRGCLSTEQATQKGFLGKTANMLFGSKPVFMLDCHVTVPQHFHRGQPVPVQISVQHSARHRESLPSGTIVPLVQLIKAEVVVDAKLSSRPGKNTEKAWEATPSLGGVIEMVAKETVAYGQDDSQRAGPSSSMVAVQDWRTYDSSLLPEFNKGNNYTQTTLFHEFSESLRSTIKTLWVRQEYLMRVKCHILVAGVKEESFERLLNVVVHPPLDQSEAAQTMISHEGRSGPVVLSCFTQEPPPEGDLDNDLPPYTP